VGDDYYLVSSSFLAVPGLPILHSKDLINWTSSTTHCQSWCRWSTSRCRATERVSGRPPSDFTMAGSGSCTPTRFRNLSDNGDRSRWDLDSADPDQVRQGIDRPMSFLGRRRAALSHPRLGQDRAGISNLLTLHRLSADGTRLLDAGEVIIDGNKIPGWTTLEGPNSTSAAIIITCLRLPGSHRGYQAVFRSKT